MASTVKLKHVPEFDDRVWSWRTVLLLGVILALMSALFYGAYRYRIGPTTPEYQGIIIDKGFSTVETEEGSGTRPWLLIELSTNERHTIYVSREIHGEAQKGMLLIKTAKGIELRPNPSADKAR